MSTKKFKTIDDIINDPKETKFLDSLPDLKVAAPTQSSPVTFSSIEDILNDPDFDSITGWDSDHQNILIDESSPMHPVNTRKNRKGYQGFEGEITDRNKRCHDFDKHEAKINALYQKMNNTPYDKVKLTKQNIQIGTALVFNGLLGMIVDVVDSENRKSGQNKRVRIVFGNGNESNLLISSFVSKFQDFKNYGVKFQ